VNPPGKQAVVGNNGSFIYFSQKKYFNFIMNDNCLFMNKMLWYRHRIKTRKNQEKKGKEP